MDGVEVDRCPDCHGIWFDADELAALLKKPPHLQKDMDADDDGHDARKAACPRCVDDPALPRIHSARDQAVTIDVCARCGGLWLDGGAFLRLSDQTSERSVFDRLKDWFSA